MIIVDCEQGSPEWFAVKLGIPSASNFKKIYTAGGNPSKQYKDYGEVLALDWLAGKQIDRTNPTYWIRRGNELEPEARAYYEFETDNDVKQIGFAYLDERRCIGVSPDGLINDDALLEIKCPKGTNLAKYYGFDHCPSEYYVQIQGQLWVMNRDYCDLFLYHPDIPSVTIRVNRDQEYITQLENEVEKFVKYLDKRKKELKGWKV